MTRFHGWRIAVAGAGLQCLQAALFLQAFGAYVATLSTERGWSKTSLSGAAALHSAEAALLGPALGWVLDRFGPVVMLRVGVVLFSSGFLVLGTVDTLAGFYAAVALIAVGSSLCGFFPVNYTLIQWFERRRARALSIVALGLAAGGLLVPIVAAAMQAYGWRATAVGSGLVALVAGWPLACVMRRSPQEVGQTVDGLPPLAAPELGAGSAAVAQRGLTARQALATPAFWLIALGHALALLVVTAVNVHAISHLKEGLGYTVAQASLVIAAMTLAQMAGSLLGSVIGDRYDKRRLSAACMLLHAAGLLLLTYAGSWAAAGSFAVLHGMAWGLRGPLMQAIRADYFGRQSIGLILGLSSIFVAVGQVAGPLVAGGLADWTGDYRAGFTVLAVLAGLGSMVFIAAKPPAGSGAAKQAHAQRRLDHP